MRIIERISEASGRLAERFTSFDEIAELDRLDDETILGVIADAAEARKALDLLISAGSSVVAGRSERSLGQSGLAQRKGHRTPTSLVQQITGQSKGDVFRSLQAGEELRDAAARRTSPPEVDAVDVTPAPPPWHEPLTDALSAGRITHAQYDAIRRSLGEPPVERYADLDPTFLSGAWRTAAEVLVGEAELSAIEELRAAARIARDRLDPIGVTLRFEQRYANRSLKTWIDEHGQIHAHIRFDVSRYAAYAATRQPTRAERGRRRYSPLLCARDAARGSSQRPTRSPRPIKTPSQIRMPRQTAPRRTTARWSSCSTTRSLRSFAPAPRPIRIGPSATVSQASGS